LLLFREYARDENKAVGHFISTSFNKKRYKLNKINKNVSFA